MPNVFVFFPDLAVMGLADTDGAEEAVGLELGYRLDDGYGLIVGELLLLCLLLFAAFAVVGLADAVGFALTVGRFVGLLVLEPFLFFCKSRSAISMPEIAAASCASEVRGNDSHKASSAADRCVALMIFSGGREEEE